MTSDQTRHGARKGTRTGRAREAPRVRVSSAVVASGPSPRATSSGRRTHLSFGLRRAKTLLAVAALLVFTIWCFYPVARVQYREQRERARLERELEALKASNAELRARVDRLKTPEGVEDVARRKMGYVREGEHAYVVTDWVTTESSATTLSRVRKRAEPPPTPVMERILDAVFGVDG